MSSLHCPHFPAHLVAKLPLPVPVCKYCVKKKEHQQVYTKIKAICVCAVKIPRVGSCLQGHTKLLRPVRKTGPRNIDLGLAWHQAKSGGFEGRTPLLLFMYWVLLGSRWPHPTPVLSRAGTGTEQACRTGQGRNGRCYAYGIPSPRQALLLRSLSLKSIIDSAT